MHNITAHVESNKQGFYSVYVNDDLPFGLIGEGHTVEEAKADFLNVYEAMNQAHFERTGERVEYAFKFAPDTSAFLQHYKSIITLAGLAKLTGINKVQLSQYVCGTRHPTPRTQDRIKQTVQQFAQELSQAMA